jgi:hypothetical protein
MAESSLACESCGQELIGTEDTCPTCGEDLTGLGPGIIGRLPVSLRQLAIIVGGLLLIIGAFMSWTRVERASGIESTAGVDEFAGILTLSAGILVIILVLLPSRFRWIGGWIAGVALIVALYNGLVVDIEGLAREVIESGVQPGLLISIVGGLLAFVPRYRLD